MKIIHHNDLDGRCAAAIVKKSLANQEDDGTGFTYIELDYKDEVPIDQVQPGEQIIIVDFSLKPPVMEKLLKVTDKILWIDHHKTAFEYEKVYSRTILGVRSREAAACKLAWHWFFKDKPLPETVELLSDYDNWDWKHGQKTKLFQLGMQTMPNGPHADIWAKMFHSDYIGTTGEDSMIRGIIERGEVVLGFREEFCETYAQSYGYKTTFEGYKCFVLPLYHFGLHAFGERINQYPLCISHVFDGNVWTVGLYSKKIDVSVIAKKHGGGGHVGAAGFPCKALPFTRQDRFDEESPSV